MTEPKILIVEDEEDIRDLIHFHLFKSKYKVLEAENGIGAPADGPGPAGIPADRG